MKMRDKSFNFDYFPNSRIKKHLIQSQVFFSKKALCAINCNGLDTTLLDEYITNSNVDFKKSKIRGYTKKMYYLSFMFPHIGVQENSYLTFEKHADSIILTDLFLDVTIPFNEATSHPHWSNCDHCY